MARWRRLGERPEERREAGPVENLLLAGLAGLAGKIC